MKRWRWLAFVGAVPTVGGVLAVIRSPRFQKWYNPPVLVVPAGDAVAEVRASELGCRETAHSPRWSARATPPTVRA